MKLIPITLLFAILFIASSFLGAANAQQNQTVYDPNTAMESVYMAQLAYCPSALIKSWACPTCLLRFPGMTNITTAELPLAASFGFVGYEKPKNRIHLVFRGTKDIAGWIEDFDFHQQVYDQTSGCGSDCLVHQGMYLAYFDMSLILIPALQTLSIAYPDADILVSSHSQGAGESVFAFADVLRKVVTKGRKLNYNFGCPRVATEPFVQWLQTVLNETQHQSFRITNAGDIITRLAPRTYVFQGVTQHWLHDPREVFYLSRNGPATAYRVCNGNYTTEDPTCNDATPKWALNPIDHTTYLGVPLGGCPLS